MKIGLCLPPLGNFSDPSDIVRLAEETEAAGWDGFFLWDHILYDLLDPPPLLDAWTLLSAAAARTSRIRLGPMVTPLARRRPWKVARETVTLDHLSGGRLVLGVGLGTPVISEYAVFGEPADERALRLDEGLDILRGLWSGRSFTFSGNRHSLSSVTFVPRPLQTPRIPVWVATTAGNEESVARAARWDGAALWTGEHSDERIAKRARRLVTRVQTFQDRADPFDVVVVTATGTPDELPGRLAMLHDAGVTWLLQAFDPRRSDARSVEDFLRSSSRKTSS